MPKLIRGKQIEQSSATPQDVSTAASVGTSNLFAKEDHVHKLTAGAKQDILQQKLVAQPDQVNAFSANGADDDVTTAITSVATNTAERNTVAAGLGILSTSTTTGNSAGTATENYKVTIRNSTTKEPVIDNNNGEVYGVLSKSAGVWTLTYYKEDGTSYSFSGATNIDFIFAEVTNLYSMDPLALMKVNQFGEMVDSNQARTFRQESITTENISGTDVVLTDNLNFTPVSNASVLLYLNGVYQEQGAGKDYTISGTAITWLANSGSACSMATTDVLNVTYVS